ncbi:MAG: tetratricopeptide repeat protein [Spirochaetales bacterium]
MRKISIFFVFLVSITLCAAQSTRPIATNIDASISTDEQYIKLSWDFNKSSLYNVQEILIFRNENTRVNATTVTTTEPIAILLPTETQFIDFPSGNENREYYYAVIARQNNGNIYDVVIPSSNATTKPVSLPESRLNNSDISATGSSSTAYPRQLPLPYIKIYADEPVNNSVTNNVTTQQKSKLTFDILPEETLGQIATGDDYTLYSIVESFILNDNRQEAQKELEQFLQINRNEKSVARANFYLGQTYYLTGQYRQALTCFQNAEKLYPQASKKWIEATLNAFSI